MQVQNPVDDMREDIRELKEDISKNKDEMMVSFRFSSFCLICSLLVHPPFKSKLEVGNSVA